MPVDQKVVAALSDALVALKSEPAHPTPTGALAALARVAKPGTRLSIDLEASDVIGAPLVTVTEGSKDTGLFDVLTARQRQVAGLLAEGRSNREIAMGLGISIATVKDHVHAILRRLDLPSRSAVIAAARAVPED